MSRKWSPAVEVARDKLFDQLEFSGLPAAERWQLIDAFAHELAEQLRDEADDETAEYRPGLHLAANLLDPHDGWGVPPERGGRG